MARTGTGAACGGLAQTAYSWLVELTPLEHRSNANTFSMCSFSVALVALAVVAKAINAALQPSLAWRVIMVVAQTLPPLVAMLMLRGFI